MNNIPINDNEVNNKLDDVITHTTNSSMCGATGVQPTDITQQFEYSDSECTESDNTKNFWDFEEEEEYGIPDIDDDTNNTLKHESIKEEEKEDDEPSQYELEYGRYTAIVSKMLSDVQSCKDGLELDELKLKHYTQLNFSRSVKKPFEPGVDPDPPEVPFAISHSGIDIVPQGGSLVITGSTGTLKSHIGLGMLAYLENPECDCFGFQIHIPHDKKAVVIDTEMQQYPLLLRYNSLKRRSCVDTITRVKIKGVRGWELKEILILLDQELSNTENGIVVLDCSTDFLEDFNSIKDSQVLIQKIMLAGTKNITVITTIHDNPQTTKSAVGGKSRGHLGTMLPQKADAALLIERDANTGLGKITNDFLFGKSRHTSFGGITQFFRWNRELCMPVSVDELDYKSAVIDREVRYVKELLSIKTTWDTSELIEHFMITEKIKENMAKKRIASLKKANILIQSKRGVYVVNGSLINLQLPMSIEDGDI